MYLEELNNFTKTEKYKSSFKNGSKRINRQKRGNSIQKTLEGVLV